MDRRELDKKMREDVKPGTESLAINEAQTAANQLLTEQRMNNESSRAVMTSNAERDTELRGAIELGSMNQPQVQQVAQQLPAQAAALRPETQQLLARYGINPQISESSRSSSNSTQTRSSNVVRKDVPNPQGGRTTVTNTTNITNITNNNTRTETDIDMPATQSAPAPVVQRVVAQPIAVAQGGDGKFKAFLNNLFAKRDLERRNQEKEFRKRDWDLQRMTRKVMERMEKISTTFAKKMNPENVGRTYGSQIKMMLTMAGLTLLPKLFPKMISGLNVVGDYVMKGVDFIKTTFSSAEGNVFEKLGTTIIESTKALGEKIDTSIGDWILAGLDKKIADANGNGKVGIVEALSTKLALMLGGDINAGEKGGKQTLGGVLGNVFNELKDYIKDMFSLQMEDRAKALDKVWSESEFSATGWADNFSNIAKLIGAAIGGTRFLERSAFNDMTKDAKEAAFNGLRDKDKGFFGGIATDNGADRVMRNISELSTDNKVSNATAIAEGTRNLYEYYTDKGYDMTIKEDDFWNIVKRVNTPDDAKKIETLINTAIKNKTIIKRPIMGTYMIKEASDLGLEDDSVTYNLGKYLYEIPKEYLPTIFSMMNGLRSKDGYGFDDMSLARSKKNLESIYDDANLYKEHLRYIDTIASANLKGQSIDWNALVGNVFKGIGDILVWDGIYETKYNQVYYDNDKNEGSDFERHGVNIAEKNVEEFRKKEDKINSKLNTGQTAVSVDAISEAVKQAPAKAKAAANRVMNLVGNGLGYMWDEGKKGWQYFMYEADMTGRGNNNYPEGWFEVEGSLYKPISESEYNRKVGNVIPPSTPTQGQVSISGNSGDINYTESAGSRITNPIPVAQNPFGEGSTALTSNYNEVSSIRNGRLHKGADFRAEAGFDIKHPFSGQVTEIGKNSVTIFDPDTGKTSKYHHVIPGVEVGQFINKGDSIGVVGSKNQTGYDPHIHFEMMDKNGNYINPMPELQGLMNDQNQGTQLESTSADFNTRVRRAMTFLMERIPGLTPAMAAGIVGNLIEESQLKTDAKNKSSEAIGLAQWLGSRKTDYLNFIKNELKKDPSQATFEDQLAFVVHELTKTHHKRAIIEMMSSKAWDPASYADIALGRYEFSAGVDKAVEELGPVGILSRERRQKYAKSALDIFNKNGGLYSSPLEINDSPVANPIYNPINGTSVANDSQDKKSYGTAGDIFAGLIKTANGLFDDTNYVDDYNPNLGSSSATIHSAIPEASPITEAAKGAQEAAEKPVDTPEDQNGTTQSDQPSMVNTGGNVMNSGNVTNESVTINQFGWRTNDDVAYSFTGTRSRDYSNR